MNNRGTFSVRRWTDGQTCFKSDSNMKFEVEQVNCINIEIMKKVKNVFTDQEK